MAKIVLHPNISNDELAEARLLENFKLSHEERMKKAFQLMKLSILFAKNSQEKNARGIKIRTQ